MQKSPAVGFSGGQTHLILTLYEKNFNFYFEMSQEPSISLETQIRFMWQSSHLISF